MNSANVVQHGTQSPDEGRRRWPRVGVVLRPSSGSLASSCLPSRPCRRGRRTPTRRLPSRRHAMRGSPWPYRPAWCRRHSPFTAAAGRAGTTTVPPARAAASAARSPEPFPSRHRPGPAPRSCGPTRPAVARAAAAAAAGTPLAALPRRPTVAAAADRLHCAWARRLRVVAVAPSRRSPPVAAAAGPAGTPAGAPITAAPVETPMAGRRARAGPPGRTAATVSAAAGVPTVPAVTGARRAAAAPVVRGRARDRARAPIPVTARRVSPAPPTEGRTPRTAATVPRGQRSRR